MAFGENCSVRQAFWVTAKKNVDSAASHVCGNGDRAKAPRLGDDFGLTGVLLGVQNLMLDTILGKKSRQVLALCNADRTN